MKKKESSSILKNDKGMSVLQFILMLFLVFVLLAVFIQIGAILRSEAFVINSAVKLAKTLQSTGQLGNVSSEQSKLANLGVSNFNVQVTPSGPLTFRQNFTLVATASYKTNFGGFLIGMNGISFPLRITIHGKSEHFP